MNQSLTATTKTERDIDARLRFEERAAICEFEGGLTRAKAESSAWREAYGNQRRSKDDRMEAL